MHQIVYRDLWRYKYQLMEPYEVDTGLAIGDRITTDRNWVVLEADGRIKLKERYAWDGPSGPTVDTHTFMRGSLVHDALYQLMRNGQLNPERWRKSADQPLRQHCLEDDMSPVRAWYVYRAVRLKGKRSTNPRPDRETKVAPRPRLGSEEVDLP